MIVYEIFPAKQGCSIFVKVLSIFPCTCRGTQ